MAGKSRIQMQMRREHQSEAVAHLVMDGWTVDQVHVWATDLGYTFSRSSWGRFARDHMRDFEDSETLRLRAQMISREFGGDAGFEVSDMLRHFLNKKTLQVLETLPSNDEAAVEKVHKMAQAYSAVTRTGIALTKMRQSESQGMVKAFEAVEARFQRDMVEDRPKLWRELQEWLREQKDAASQLAAE